MNTSERSLRQPQGGGQDLWLSIHCWLQTWVPAPSPAIEGRAGGVVGQREKEREASKKNHNLCLRFNAKREKRFQCRHLEKKPQTPSHTLLERWSTDVQRNCKSRCALACSKARTANIKQASAPGWGPSSRHDYHCDFRQRQMPAFKQNSVALMVQRLGGRQEASVPRRAESEALKRKMNF